MDSQGVARVFARLRREYQKPLQIPDEQFVEPMQRMVTRCRMGCLPAVSPWDRGPLARMLRTCAGGAPWHTDKGVRVLV